VADNAFFYIPELSDFGGRCSGSDLGVATTSLLTAATPDMGDCSTGLGASLAVTSP